MKIHLVFLSLALCLACTRHGSPTVEDRFQKIQAKIDRKNYQEAEDELKEILAQEPGNERAKVILASVSVHKAGITMKEYFVLEKLARLESTPSAERPVILDLKNLEKLKVGTNSELNRALHFLRQLDEAAGKAQEIAEKFNQIPELNDESAEHIFRALKEMGSMPMQEDGNALYRGVVKILYFKYLWNHQRFLKFGEGQFCSYTVASLSRDIDVFHLYTVGMIRDLGRGFPKSKAQFENLATQMDEHFRKALQFLKQHQKTPQTFRELIESLAKTQSISGLSCDF